VTLRTDDAVLNENNFKSLLVLDRFAEAFRTQTYLNKTQLHLQSKLRWDLYNKYLNWLLQKEYVKCQIKDGIENYSLTEAGQKMFNMLGIFLSVIL